ncbi:MAG: rhodanese [Bacteroidetes bacterium MedPE-SWsnd-G2]|nr:MAG: rhodanese [Bacteroidetes bacterium MedPE-SWsnd-G2]
MKHYIFILCFFVSALGFSQNTIPDVIEKYNTHSVKYINVEELNSNYNEYLILDSREQGEYNVSHLKNAINIGFENFNIDASVNEIKDFSKPIVVYCSIGVRSEIIGEKLKEKGFTNVFNLYGGIFEWKNQGLNVYNRNNIKTENVHVFSKEWSKFLKSGQKTH